MIPCFTITRMKLKLSLLVLAIFVHFLPVLVFYPVVGASQSVPQCHEDERSALLELKKLRFSPYSDGTCFDSWEPAEGEESGNCCAWDKIECDRHTSHVIGLDLSDCGLSTDLNSNSSIFQLTHLEKLDLANNNFMGSPIPSTIGNLLRLKVLNLSDSEFKGQVPPEILRLTNLSSLDLSGEYLSNLELKKPDMGDLARSLTKLEELHLHGLNMSARIPDALGLCTSLKSLKLSMCELHGELPTSIWKLPNLQVLDLSFNKGLSGELPASLESSKSLRELELSGCSFGWVIPSPISNCTKLEILRLFGNGFHGQLPSLLGLKQLTELDLSFNMLSGEISSSIGELNMLSILDLSSNQLTGPIPSSIGNLTQLSHLDLRDNQLTGPIPSSLGESNLLSYLDLSSNQLTGPIPSYTGNLTMLDTLYLNYNKLTGPIPSSIGNLILLREFTLWLNQLTGPIPSSIGNLTQLDTLGLTSNNLTGPIPSSIGNLNQLSSLDLSSNTLTGPIPSFLANLTLLSSLSLSSNRFTGSIPPSLGNLTNLGYLDIGSNQLVGPIPHSFRNLTLLRVLEMSSNRLSGQIPSFLVNISYLTHLNLSHNQFTGIVQLGSLSDTQFIDLSFNKLQGPLPVPSWQTEFYSVSNNSLSGEIPPQFCNLSYPQVLDLAHNNLTGSIPQCLSNLSSTLGILSLRDNKLSGVVTPLFKQGCWLNMIDFSNNQLEGPLPHSLANCKGLEFLNFGNNLIDDKFPSWLGSLSNLTVLLLGSNRFHGQIEKPHKSDPGFPKLQIIDLSRNNFQGSLPSNYFKHWKAMRVSNLNKSGYLGETFGVDHIVRAPYYALPAQDYDYSMAIFNKGTYMLYPKIFHAVTTIDLSCNNFSGEIPRSLGSLQGLRLLNMSDNLLTGRIPLVLSNLTQLEALDLSRNTLSAEIPYQLTGLKSLSFFDVSYNHLSGSIPRGLQFDTFANTSYTGNPGLCGFPLSKKCGDDKEAPPPPYQNGRHDSDALLEFDWEIILPGFACGIVIGAVLGQGVPIERDNWFVRKFGRRYRRRRR